MNSKYIFYSPNVHTGGGLVLFKELEDALLDIDAILILDERIKSKVSNLTLDRAFFFPSTIHGRISAEIMLYKLSNASSEILCFHNLPPLLSVKGNVSVFFQNVHIAKLPLLKEFPLKVWGRIYFESLFFRAFKFRLNAIFVQSDSVADKVKHNLGISDLKIRVMPFSMRFEYIYSKEIISNQFVYVADGLPHKNHINLIKAWNILAKKGFFPTLMLTLNNDEYQLLSFVNDCINRYGVSIKNLGVLPHSEVIKLYSSSEALVFPSLAESFGLPLIEAYDMGLPIIAGELDYVRDVCSPKETFNPSSPLSIARAILRFKKINDFTKKIITGKDFISNVFSI